MTSRKRNSMSVEVDEPLQNDALQGLLPLPAQDAHKYSRGTLSVVAGSKRYPGAAVLACLGAQRMGAGYTQLYAPASVREMALSARPSLVAYPRSALDGSVLGAMKHPERQAICVGCGFVAGNKRTDGLVVDLLEDAPCAVLVDGGALGALGAKRALRALARRKKLGRATVITPHAGEAQRLAKDVCLPSDDPAGLACALALALGATVVLKGPDTYISQGLRTYPMREGTPALAKAGTGDVLAGMIAALLAQGLDAVDAAVLGTTLHARAGAIAAERNTVVCVVPEDVVAAIPAAVRSLLSEGQAWNTSS